MLGTIKQGSFDWKLQRMGMVTASRFKDVLTKPRGKKEREAGEMSATAKAYLQECLTELLLNKPLAGFTSPATDWGNEWEAEAFEQAAEAIEKVTGVRPDLPEGDDAFLYHPDEDMVGCSPDGLLGESALLEIKCPFNPTNHLNTYLTGVPDKHEAQMQGSLWISGREEYIFVSYDHRFKDSPIPALLTYPVKRDDEYIDTELGPAVVKFRDALRGRHEMIMAEYNVANDIPF